MTKKLHHELSKVNKIPKGVPFVQLTYELINSPAWRMRSINCIRLIDFLLLENMRHSGQENGNLLATYDQLVSFGIGRGYINRSICEAEQLGIILVKHGTKKGYANSDCNIFTLTFCPAKNHNSKLGSIYYTEPTNDWKNITMNDVKSWNDGKRNYKAKRKKKLKFNSLKMNSHSARM